MDNGDRSIETSLELADHEGRAWFRPGRGDLQEALRYRQVLTQGVDVTLGTSTAHVIDRNMDALCTKVLTFPSSERWRTAASTALLGEWSTLTRPDSQGRFASLAVLRAEARSLHRQLVPLWRRKARHGRVLSLDAAIGDRISLYDLVAGDVDILEHTTRGMLEDERLHRVLRGLNPAERAVVFAYAEGWDITWTQAAITAGATQPEAFGERVRRKTKRLAAEQQRRARSSAQRRQETSA
ncbi:hypothetical protein AB0D86_47775 [Streptomyces sp. NPDC048324]|uniref:hypothetical protein n=1 Tax=Streptomyces sp. NPDC048324 TaxID=3157205 RepID=UPI00342DAB52